MTLLPAVLAAALAAPLPAYTNHAGHVVRGVPVAVTNGLVVLSRDGWGERAVPLSAFPPSEQSRLRAAAGVRPPVTTPARRRAAFARDMRLRREALKKSAR